MALAPPDLRLDRDQLIARHRVRGHWHSDLWRHGLRVRAEIRDLAGYPLLSPQRLYNFILYTGVFLVELVRANINMMRYVYAPRVSVNPGVVKVKTGLKSPIGRLALANSISLTPGSLVLDMSEVELTVHCLDMRTIDANDPSRTIARPFEKHLEKSFG